MQLSHQFRDGHADRLTLLRRGIPLAEIGLPLQLREKQEWPAYEAGVRLLEQRPRAQSRGTATLLPYGHGYVFTTRDRPVASKRGWSAAPVRHGVSAIRSGERHTLALVFHDAA